MFYVRLCNFPDLYRENNILRFLTKKIPEFKHSKLLMESRDVSSKYSQKKKKQFSGSVLVQANDRQSIDALLLLHGFRLQGQILQSWLMGYEYDSLDAETSGSSTVKFDQMFKNVNAVKDKDQVHNRSKVSAVVNPEEKEASKPAAKADDSDDEFQVKRLGQK